MEHQIELDGIDYRQRQDREEITYTAAYRAWVESLPDDERQQLAALGLSEPSAPGFSSGVGLDRDTADDAVTEALEPADDEEIHDWKTASDLRTAEAIAKLISELLATDPTLGAECIALATGIAYAGCSENAISKKYGVSRAAVSKRCIELCEKLGVKNRRAMKSEHAREVYSESATQAHARAGREITGELPRAARVATMGAHATRIAGVWARVQKSEWIRSASAGDLLLARRSLRPALMIADELERLIRAKGNAAIVRELEHDLAGQA